ncbi:uncharacterized protein LOC143782730 [Ranitomeya variabilis]|uniref:uncharacterized protein LOC143782730 n=1 Tax=Ranitomeya variabilis TaxID=490064 RepID=UPI004057C96D
MDNNLEDLAAPVPSGTISSPPETDAPVETETPHDMVRHQDSDSGEASRQPMVVSSPSVIQPPSQQLVPGPIRSYQRGRRNVRHQDLPLLAQEIDVRILQLLSNFTPENDAERFARSLAPQIEAVPRQRQGWLRAALITLIDASQEENDPTLLYTVIEDWRRAQHVSQQQPAVQSQHQTLPPTQQAHAGLSRPQPLLPTQQTHASQSQHLPSTQQTHAGQTYHQPLLSTQQTHAGQNYQQPLLLTQQTHTGQTYHQPLVRTLQPPAGHLSHQATTYPHNQHPPPPRSYYGFPFDTYPYPSHNHAGQQLGTSYRQLPCPSCPMHQSITSSHLGTQSSNQEGESSHTPIPEAFVGQGEYSIL